MDASTFERFFLPSETLTKRIAERVESLEFEATEALKEKSEYAEPLDSSLEDVYREDLGDASSAEESSDQEVMLQRRMLAEALYYNLARCSQAARGEALNVGEAIAQGRGTALGLPDNDALLKELSEEFQAWIAETGIFTAGWGNIIWAGAGSIHLEPFPVKVATSTQAPDLTFFHPYPKKTLGAKLKAFAHRVGLQLLILI
jgi:hypothetical protein